MKMKNHYDGHVLDAAERVLRRNGAYQLSLANVAQELGVATLALTFIGFGYAGLREMVIARKLSQITNYVSELSNLHQSTTAEIRLSNLLDSLVRASRIFQREDPELFEAYRSVSKDQAEVVLRFQRELITQIEAIITHGAKAGEFTHCDPRHASWATLGAIAPFYDPSFGRDWSAPGEHGAYKHARASALRALVRVTDAKSPLVDAQRRAAKALSLTLHPGHNHLAKDPREADSYG